MNRELLDHMLSVLPLANQQGWGKIYRVDRTIQDYVVVDPINPPENIGDEPLMVYDKRFLLEPHFMLKLVDGIGGSANDRFKAGFLISLFDYCRELGFIPLFKSKADFIKSDWKVHGEMSFTTTVHCPTDTDGILLQSYLDTLEH